MISSCRTKSIRITPGSPRLNGPGTCAGVSTPMKTEGSLPGHATRYAEDRAEDRGAGPRACLGPRLAHAPHPYGAGVLVGRQGDHRYLRQAGLAAVRLRRRFVVWGPRGARAEPVGILLAEDLQMPTPPATQVSAGMPPSLERGYGFFNDPRAAGAPQHRLTHRGGPGPAPMSSSRWHGPEVTCARCPKPFRAAGR